MAYQDFPELDGPVSDAAGGFSADLAEQFLRHVMAYEQAPTTNFFRQLEESGLELPAPADLDDAQLTDKLWQVIEGLARLRVFLTNTDHLSDRQLYQALWSEGLREPVADSTEDEPFPCNLDLLGSGSARAIHLHLKYYADDEYRRTWAEQVPGDDIPAHEDPPFDRDRYLPNAEGRPQRRRRRQKR
jgi:hypothetical protein